MVWKSKAVPEYCASTGKPEKSLEPIDWEDFFDTFDSHQPAFLYQESTASGAKSRFHKFVARDSVHGKRH